MTRERIDEHWEIAELPGFYLFLDGKPIRNADGEPFTYLTEQEARSAAANWQPMPTYAEIQAMSDEEIHMKIRSGLVRHRIRWLLWRDRQ